MNINAGMLHRSAPLIQSISASLRSDVPSAVAEAVQEHLGLALEIGSCPNGPDAGAQMTLTKPGTDFGALEIDVLEQVAPLDAQFGVVERRSIPDALEGWLTDGKGSLFVVLDAAKVPLFDGPDSAGGLPCRSLYQGDAAETLASVAPYIVELDPAHELTRRLFTRTGRPDDLWDAAPGILLRSEAKLDDLRQSLRKFTKLQDDSGKPYFLRFFDPRWSLAIQLAFSGGEAARFFKGVDAVVSFDPDTGLALRSRYRPPVAEPRPAPLSLRPEMVEMLAQRRLDVARREALQFCQDSLADFTQMPPDQARQFSNVAIQTARRAGLRIEQAAHLAVAAQWIMGDLGGTWLPAQYDIVGRRDLSQTAKARALFERAFDFRQTVLRTGE